MARSNSWQFHDRLSVWWPRSSAPILVVGAFGLLLGVWLSKLSTAEPGYLFAWRLAELFLLFGAAMAVRYHLFERAPSDLGEGVAFVVYLGLTAFLVAIIYQSGSPGVGFGINRSADLAVVFLVAMAYFVAYPGVDRFTIPQWLAVGCFAIVFGLFCYHSLAESPGSPWSRNPLWSGVLMGTGLFVIPRLVPERAFVSVVGRLGALAAALGLYAFVAGEFSVWVFDVRLWRGTFSPPIVDAELAIIQSVFVNPNTLGAILFPAAIASAVELHRSFADTRPILAPIVPAALVVVNWIALYLTNSRASQLSAAVALAIYLAYVAGGRRMVPLAVVGVGVATVAFLAAVYFQLIDVNPGNRFTLWRASLRAILASSSPLVGEGLVAPGGVIGEYLPGGGGASPHNSYLSVFIRTGLLGGLAYLGLVVGSIAYGMVRYRTVNVAMLVLAFGWMVHQLFEVYTMFSWNGGSIFASLTFGYLLFDAWHDDGSERTDRPRPASNGRSTGGRRGRRGRSGRRGRGRL